jgi:NAD(P)-dependent dehydrogenase (short-subunit alcohol dehydrogenase family)
LAELHGLPEDHYEADMSARNGLGRLLTPDEVAEVAVWLLERPLPTLTGQAINVCGTLEGS